GEYDCLLLAACHWYVETTLVGCRKRVGGKTDKDLMDGFALSGIASHRDTVVDMPEILVNDPAVINDQIAPFGESLYCKECPVGEAMFSIPRLASRSHSNPVAGSDLSLCRPVNLESVGVFQRQSHLVRNDQPRAFREAGGILVKLDEIARLVVGRVNLL